MVVRPEDHPGTRFYRSCRLYLAENRWWFDTREGVQFGPFSRRLGAVCSLAVYLAQHAHEGGRRWSSVTDTPGSQDNVAHMVEEILAVLRQHGDFGRTAARSWAMSRLEDLRSGRVVTPETVGRIQVLEFSLCHPDQTFDFEHFLQHQAE